MVPLCHVGLSVRELGRDRVLADDDVLALHGLGERNRRDQEQTRDENRVNAEPPHGFLQQSDPARCDFGLTESELPASLSRFSGAVRVAARGRGSGRGRTYRTLTTPLASRSHDLLL